MAGPIGIAVRGRQATVIDAVRGTRLVTISGDVVDASTDGETIAVVRPSGRVDCFSERGSMLRSLSVSDAVGCSLSSGVIVVRSRDGRTRRFNARSGSFLGGF